MKQMHNQPRRFHISRRGFAFFPHFKNWYLRQGLRLAATWDGKLEVLVGPFGVVLSWEPRPKAEKFGVQADFRATVYGEWRPRDHNCPRRFLAAVVGFEPGPAIAVVLGVV